MLWKLKLHEWQLSLGTWCEWHHRRRMAALVSPLFHLLRSMINWFFLSLFSPTSSSDKDHLLIRCVFITFVCLRLPCMMFLGIKNGFKHSSDVAIRWFYHSVVSLCGCEKSISVLIWWNILFLSTLLREKPEWHEVEIVWIWITLMTELTETWIKEKCGCSDYPECTKVHAGGSGFDFFSVAVFLNNKWGCLIRFIFL